MSASGQDTIVALASPWGRGAVSLLRLSGEGALGICMDLCPGAAAPSPRRASLRRARDAAGEVLDELLVTYMPGPGSYTGEDLVELSGHGNPVLVEALLGRCVELGARPARPGEFSRRAVLNGRLSLVEAEAVAALIAASSPAGLHTARRAGRGLARELDALRARLLGLAAEVEVRLDHPGEELGQASDARLIAELSALRDEAMALAAGWQGSRLRLHGARVALLGPVNAGKSSLFNALLGQARALVSPLPGTTRDVVEQRLLLDGQELCLLDTAGERPTVDPVEAAGLVLGRELTEDADLFLLVLPGHQAPGPEEALLRARLQGRPHRVVLSHADLPLGPGREVEDLHLVLAGPAEALAPGVEALRLVLREELARLAPAGQGRMLASQRQHALLRSVAAQLDEAIDCLQGEVGPAVAAEALVEALQRLSELTGADVREEVLDEVFARFCIGK